MTLLDYCKNVTLLDQAVAEDAAIFPIANHRLPDGTLNMEGDRQVWAKATAPFLKTYLWEEGAPGFDPEKTPEQENPYLIFVPALDENEKPFEKENVNNTIIVSHGGGFSWRTGCEGFNVAHFFLHQGFNVAILAYRLIPYSRLDAMADLNRAIRILKSRKEEWHLGEKIAVMGFSAGAMLSGNIATHPEEGQADAEDPIERENTLVDAAVIGYGAFSMVSFPRPLFMPFRGSVLDGRTPEEQYYLALEKHVTPSTPPMFIWQTLSDDGRHGMTLAKALQDANVPYELHIFTSGVHGLAMADGHNDLGMDIPHIAHWGQLCTEWLRDLGL